MKKLLLFVSILGLAACSGSNKVTDLNGEQVFFAFDSAKISEPAREDLLAQSVYMKDHSNVDVIIEGHCDERGSTDYNLALGALRAGNAAHVLIKDGVQADRIKTISYGKEKPQYQGTGDAVWAKNRNATTVVVK